MMTIMIIGGVLFVSGYAMALFVRPGSIVTGLVIPIVLSVGGFMVMVFGSLEYDRINNGHCPGIDVQIDREIFCVDPSSIKYIDRVYGVSG